MTRINTLLTVLCLTHMLFIGCSSINKGSMHFIFDPAQRRLEILSMDSGRNIIKVATKINNDTLTLYVYQKPFFLTVKKENQKAYSYIHIDTSIHYLQYRDSVYEILILPTPK